tara:strand:+ start:209 stop:544 length:336 start_codon:yes stop_codon:yes gene_type:complete
MKIKHKVNKIDNQVVVNVALDSFSPGQHRIVSNVQVEEYLRNNNIKINQCIANAHLDNAGSILEGEWVFSLDNPNGNVVTSSSENSNSSSEEETKTVASKPKIRRAKPGKK